MMMNNKHSQSVIFYLLEFISLPNLAPVRAMEAPVDTHRPREATAVDSAETTIVPACPNFTTGAHAILAHQDILGGWRVGLTNSSPVLNFEEERGRAPD